MKTRAIMLKLIAMIFIAAVEVHTVPAQIPPTTHARILKLEDERNLNNGELEKLLENASPNIRARAALAIGRIGDKSGTSGLINLFRNEKIDAVRVITAFALGEMEDQAAIDALQSAIDNSRESFELRARSAEAMGKILSLPSNIESTGKAGIERLNESIIRLLPLPSAMLPPQQRDLTGLLITALMRIRSASSVEPLTLQLKSRNPEIRSQAANALSRLRMPIATSVPALIKSLRDADEDARANAARALGVTKDKSAVDPLIAALSDKSDKVVVSALRALASISDSRAVMPLLDLGQGRLKMAQGPLSDEADILLELSVALGSFKDERALPFLRELREWSHEAGGHPEIEIAIARFGAAEFFKPVGRELYPDYDNWRHLASFASGLGELPVEVALDPLLKMLNSASSNPRKDLLNAVPEILRALVKIKTKGVDVILRDSLASDDESIRTTAASLIANFPADENLKALIAAFNRIKDQRSTDDKPALLTALSKYRNPEAVNTIKSALTDRDHLIRRRAIELLKQAGVGDFSNSIGIVDTGHTTGYYSGLIRLMNRKIMAVINTNKGPITLELYPKDAPNTVQSFISLSKKGFFNGISFHRVVSNFVIQGGDPQGTGEGGPGYQIRCEINTKPYLRGALGMALSGKDTGGSQFFITHAPQPHLDGGYTVFGKVINGMKIVDRIVRGDSIKSILILNR